jgi:hypothetical protein
VVLRVAPKESLLLMQESQPEVLVPSHQQVLALSRPALPIHLLANSYLLFYRLDPFILTPLHTLFNYKQYATRRPILARGVFE